MCKRNLVCVSVLTIFLVFVLFIMYCSGGESEKATSRDNFVIYGIDINKLSEMKFGDIEEEWSVEADIDSAICIVAIKKEGDFIKKTKKTPNIDYLEVVHAMAEDYASYKDLSPNKIFLSGQISVREVDDVKDAIVKELEKNLPDNAVNRKKMKDIREKFILGNFKDGFSFGFIFSLPEFPYSEFGVSFFRKDKDEEFLYYRYIFSKDENLFPYN